MQDNLTQQGATSEATTGFTIQVPERMARVLASFDGELEAKPYDLEALLADVVIEVAQDLWALAELNDGYMAPDELRALGQRLEDIGAAVDEARRSPFTAQMALAELAGGNGHAA